MFLNCFLQNLTKLHKGYTIYRVYICGGWGRKGEEAEMRCGGGGVREEG